jgi:ATP-dependent DNA helicase RecG
VRLNGYKVPRNAALLFFNHDPEQFFRGAHIDVVQFVDDAGGDLIEGVTDGDGA